jgi:hypothetical protein
MIAHAYNPSYWRGESRRMESSRLALPLSQEKLGTEHKKKKREGQCWGTAQVVECFQGAMGLIPRTEKKKKMNTLILWQ